MIAEPPIVLAYLNRTKGNLLPTGPVAPERDGPGKELPGHSGSPQARPAAKSARRPFRGQDTRPADLQGI